MKWQDEVIQAGGEVFEVGGTVRDGFIGREIKDRDFLITGIPMPNLQVMLGKFGRVSQVGKSFGVLKFNPTTSSSTTYDLAIPRREISTGTGHRDFTVEYDYTLPVEHDLARRDFTINAMARNVRTGDIVDPFHGREDLQKGVLRQVFPNSFVEDPLRLLRAVQFAARFNLTIDPETYAGMIEHAKLIETVSTERIIEELAKLLSAEKPSLGFYMMADVGILRYIFPELEACRGIAQAKQENDDVFRHTMRVLDAARSDDHIRHKNDLNLLFAAIYHDVGKPHTRLFDEAEGRETFYGHQIVSKRIAKRRLRELKVSTIGVDYKLVCHLVEHHMFETKAYFTDKAIRRFINKIGKDEISLLMDLRLADNRGGKYPAGIKGVLRLQKRIQEELDKKPPFGPKDLAIGGLDLMELGIPSGPLMGQILNHLAQLCLDDPALNERESLIELAKEFPITS